MYCIKSQSRALVRMGAVDAVSYHSGGGGCCDHQSVKLVIADVIVGDKGCCR